MNFIEFSRNEILILSNIIRLVRKETGLPLKMQSENFLTRLNTAITACKDPRTHQLYQEFLNTFSQPEVLQQLGLIRPRSSEEIKKTVYRGQQVQTSQPSAPPASSDGVPPGKRKIIYRGQVKYVDK